ncbi:MAG: hypothetical protein JSV91_01285 [Phycisphaerales bacterium]|nr:MAG: hypothetical protein JSV91_01285 [Phycisphaerales bacterium]
MPLITCPDCGASVSDSAPQCTKCGCPIATQLVACPECQAKSFRTAAACPQCGYPLDQIKTEVSAPPRPATEAPQPVRVEQTIIQEPGPGRSVGEGVQRSAEIAQGMGAAMAMHKSFVGHSFGTLAAYLFLYPLGFILNLVFLHEARRIRKVTGISPSGSGCLAALLLFFFWIPLIGTLAFVIMLTAGVLAI